MSTVVELRTSTTGTAVAVQTAADAFLDSLRTPNTLRSYTTAVTKTADRLGTARPLAAVADDEIGEVLELLWGEAAVNTWNARRAGAVLARLMPRAGPHRARRSGLGQAAHPTRLRHPVRSRTAIDRPGKVLGPRDVCPDTGLGRLSYGQARAVLDEHTATAGPGTGRISPAGHRSRSAGAAKPSGW